MVKSKMESRIEGLEREMGTFKEDLGNLKEYLLEMRELMRLRDEKEDARNREKETTATAENSNGGGEDSRERTRRDDQGKEERKIKRLELPVFNGDDPIGWTFRTDRYFHVNRFEEEEKVEAAAVCMEGRALSWYQWEDSRAPIQTWELFKAALIERFRPSFQGSPQEALVGVKQTGTVTEFRERFEAQAAPLREVREDMLMGIFLNGLKEENSGQVENF